MADIRIFYADPEHLNRRSIGTMENIAQEAWTEDLRKTRSPEEVAYRFNTTNRHLDEVEPTYRDFARHGQIAAAFDGQEMVGFAMARNDVSPKQKSPLALGIRTAKRVEAAIMPRRSRVYAWLYHVSVRPEYQRLGVASDLVYKVYDQRFDPSQPDTAYVFDEDPAYQFDAEGQIVATPDRPFQSLAANNGAYHFAHAMGYRLGREPQFKSRPGYFGPGSRPVVQYRLTGTVDRTLMAARRHGKPPQA